MSKQYYLKFGTGNPQAYAGLTPTFTLFAMGGQTNGSFQTLLAPGITEGVPGSGIYGFLFGPPTMSICFVAFGGANLSATDAYIFGGLDPVQAVDVTIGQPLTDSFGSTSADPTTIAGYCRRNLEFNEGDKTYIKSTGIWDIYARGSTEGINDGTLLREKILTNTVTSATSS